MLENTNSNKSTDFFPSGHLGVTKHPSNNSSSFSNVQQCGEEKTRILEFLE